MHNNLNNKSILITGGTGSWGQELVKQLLEKYNCKEIRIYSRGEHRQVDMERKFKNNKLKFIIGDVRDKDRLNLATEQIDIIFHLAALKHVPVCENNPWEAVQTNIIGTQNVINCAIENKVEKVIDVSTDKAVDPFNLYGVTKACGEKLIIAANLLNSQTKFVCIRGGNVLGTNGSVVPLFKEQILKLNEITLTHKEMTRFLFRLEEAIKLILHASLNSIGGEVFVMKMPGCKITELADVMVSRLGNDKTKIKVVGIRPGEKLYELLISRYEMNRTFDLKKYFVILPQINLPETENFYKNKKNLKIGLSEFNSNNTKIMTKKEIEAILDKDGWLTKIEKDQAINYLNSLSKKDLKSLLLKNNE